MSLRAASTGAPSSRPASWIRSSIRAWIALLAVALLTPAGCGDPELRGVTETFEVVGGEPQVDPTLPTVQRGGGGANPNDFASSSPVQIDTFVQKQVAKVDILWVIDNSGSMDSKQTKVKQNFQAFIAKLVSDNHQLDYHIGVITTDTYSPAESGKLQNVKVGTPLPKPWIGPDTCSGACNPVAKFRELSSVGINGTGDEKPLLAATMALSPPLSSAGGANGGFVRDDAALFIIILSDEEDSSCAPVVDGFGGGCAPHVTSTGRFGLDFGEVDYYARFFEGLKGYGRKEFVTVGAIVALSQDRLALGAGTAPRVGCTGADQNYGVYAPRTISVAQATGGLATSICDANYSTALTNLGFLATGAKTTFLLSRAPFANDIKVYVTLPGGQRTLQTAGRDYTYRPCTGQGGATPYNAIEFTLSAIPPASATIEVEYPVNVRGVTCP